MASPDAQRADISGGSSKKLPDTATIYFGGGRAVQLLLAGDALTGIYLDLSARTAPYF